jgi:hypothetical protein
VTGAAAVVASAALPVRTDVADKVAALFSDLLKRELPMAPDPDFGVFESLEQAELEAMRLHPLRPFAADLLARGPKT